VVVITGGGYGTIRRGVHSQSIVVCVRVLVCLFCVVFVLCLCRVFVSRLFVCLFVLCVLCVLCVVCSSAELRNFVFGCFLPYQIPYLSSTGLSRVLALLGLRPARPYSIIPQSCGILCCWFFCHIKPPISPSTGLSHVLALLGLRPASPYSIIPQSCGILCCWFFLPYQTPYLAEYGPSCVVGR